MRDFNAHNPLWGNKKMSTRGRMIEKIFNRYSLLCINKKEETYYRAFNSSISTINLTIASLTIASELKWSKEFKFRGSNHFPIIIENEREVSMKQQQRWSIGGVNWMKFQKESTITMKVQNQNTIKEAHSCLVKTLLQTAEKTIPKTSSETKRRPTVA